MLPDIPKIPIKHSLSPLYNKRLLSQPMAKRDNPPKNPRLPCVVKLQFQVSCHCIKE
ncbi:Hypothetical protein I595_2400 [Croceitalea dokdonensis DOKDO 023]|uniref:Uncharacterized protein n=1 Tax=Croceitalea dokdonensis DOKDO 023 TaxID=1300341 RepID=A0A0P7AD52_9FLAO|nr:Hypothetical protein I595_2400 [Croceitalea dokdonensis DOKDO 023]